MGMGIKIISRIGAIEVVRCDEDGERVSFGALR